MMREHVRYSAIQTELQRLFEVKIAWNVPARTIVIAAVDGKQGDIGFEFSQLLGQSVVVYGAIGSEW